MDIKRTPTQAIGGITEYEKIQMQAISKKWIDIAFHKGSVNKEKLIEAIKRLYHVSGLKEPRVVVVPSPLIMAYAYGLSAGWWHQSVATRVATDDATEAATRDATCVATYDATRDATEAATRDATRVATCDATRVATDATRAATYVATRDATYAATDDATDAAYAATDVATDVATYAATCVATRAAYAATRDATCVATDVATDVATRAATDDATRAATYVATRDATYAATRVATCDATYVATDVATDVAKPSWLNLLAIQFAKGNRAKSKLMIDCISRWTNVYQGGNMWAAHHSYYEAMRDVLNLSGLNCWDKYKAWEDCGKLGGFRVMHPEFCLVSEFPEILLPPIGGKLHCSNGPTHRWKDGFEIYHLNGIRVPKWLVMTDAGKINPELALTENNVDIQREIIRKVGAERMLKASNAKTLDTFIDSHTKGGNEYKLMQMKVGEIDRKYLYFEHASFPGVYYAQPVNPNLKRALHARAWMLSIGEVDELEKMSDVSIQECLPVEVA